MLTWLNGRQKTEALFLIFLIAFAFASIDAYTNHWIFLSFVAGIVLIVGNTIYNPDLLFTADNAFVYDPEYKNWKDKVEKNLNY